MKVAQAQEDRLSEWSMTSGGEPIPSGWRLVRLGEVSEHCLGKMLDQQKQTNGEWLPYLRNPNVQWFGFDLRSLEQMPFQSHELTRYEIKDGDVIICEGGEPGRSAIWEGGETEIKFQKALHRVRPSSELLNRFLVRRLQFDARSGRLKWYFTGTTIKHFTGQDLHRYLLPLPPLSEQRRIAAILDKADAIQRKREKGIRLTEDLLRSTFLEMFGDPEANPKGWVIQAVNEVVAEMEGGKSILADASESESTQYRVLKVSAVTWADYRPHESKPVPAKYVPPVAHIVKKGDLLFSRANTTELVGATVYVFDTPPNHLLPDKLWRFVWREDRPMDPQYVRMLFMTPAIKRELGKRATGTSGSMKNISKAKLMTIGIPVPPVDLQRKFGKIALAQHKALTARRDGAEATVALFGSLAQRAFRGEL